MALGQSFDWGKTTIRDPQTGREYWRMTTDGFTNHSPYMYNRAFSRDEKYVVVCSDRTGTFQIYRISLESGEAMQLTNVEKLENMGIVVEETGREVYFCNGSEVRTVDIETAEDRLIADYSTFSGYDLPYGRPVASNDGREILMILRRQSDDRFFLAKSEVRGSKPEIVYEFPFREKISHLLCHPTDKDVITFVPPDKQNDFSLPPEQRARAWKVNLATGEAAPFVVGPDGFRCTHEYWAPDGSRMYFHVKKVPGWIPASIASIDKNGGDWQTHITSETIKLGHSAINRAMTHIVSDSQQPGTNPLVLVELATGRQETLCWPNATGAPHPNHIHPNFSPSGDYIVFTSDSTGTAQVYIVPLRKG